MVVLANDRIPLPSQTLQKRFNKAKSNALDHIHNATVRKEILEVIIDWLRDGGGAQDILDNTALYHAVGSFLTSASDLISPPPSLKDDPAVSDIYTNLSETLATLNSLFTSQTMRPYIHPLFSQDGTSSTVESHNFGREAPDLDTIQPEELVDNLDAMAAAAFRNVTEEVYIHTFYRAQAIYCHLSTGLLHRRRSFGSSDYGSTRMAQRPGC